MILSRPIIPAEHIKNIDYAVRGPLEKISDIIKQQGKRVIHLNIGDPARYSTQETPAELRKIILDLLEKGDCLAYDNSRGVPNIRQIIADNCSINGVSGKPVTKDDIFIGNGSTELITFCIEALIREGDGILVPDPGYPLYDALIKKVRGKSQFYRLGKDWKIDIDELEKAVDSDTKAIVVINPGNPTGRNLRKELLQEIRNFADKHGLVVFADEVYSHLNYDGKEHVPLASLSGKYPVLTFGSLSKNYLAPGFRVGWMIRTDPSGITQDYWDAIEKLASIRLCSAPLLQHAIIPAFTDAHTSEHTCIDRCDSFTEKLKKNAELTFNMMNNKKAGISCARPEAGFYAFVKLDLPDGVKDFDFAKELLEETGIYVNNGSGFGPSGEGHIRIVFLPDHDTLKDAYAKIINFKKTFKEPGMDKPKYMVD